MLFELRFLHTRGAPVLFTNIFYGFLPPLGSFDCVVLYIMPAFLAIYGNLHCTFFITFFCTCDNILPVAPFPVYLFMVVETDGHKVGFLIRSALCQRFNVVYNVSVSEVSFLETHLTKRMQFYIAVTHLLPRRTVTLTPLIFSAVLFVLLIG